MSLAVSSAPHSDPGVPLFVGGHTVYVGYTDFSALVGYTVYLSTGHSSDPTVTSGELLKVRA